MELDELSETALCSSSAIELAADELLELEPEPKLEPEPRLWLNFSSSLAPGELPESDASWERAELAADESPALRACTIA